MTDSVDSRERDSTRSKRDYFLTSIRETDEKIKTLFKDILDERKNTQKYLSDNIDRAITPSGDNHQNISFNSGKGDSRRGSYRQNKENISANTSALLDEEDKLEDTFTVLNTTNKKNNNSERKGQTINIQGEYATMDADSNFDISGLGSPIDPAKIIGSLRKETRENKYDDYKKPNGYRDKYEEDTSIVSSGNRLLDTLKSDDFALTGGEIPQRKSAVPQGPVYQVSKQEINFGILFPTEVRSESFEIFNKMNKDLEFEVTVISENANVGYSLSLEKEQGSKPRISFKVNKFSFQTVYISTQTSFYGNENGSYKATIKIRSEDKDSIINLKCEVEKPMLQLMNSYVERLVGQVPFIQFDTNSSSDPKMPFAFKNNGKKQIHLEFELVQDSKLAEVLFSPKYLNINEGEEKSVVIRMVSQFEDRDKKRAIVKYRIRGTTLSQCIVINFV